MPQKAAKSGAAAKTFSCLMCDKQDNTRMVACDNCEAWFHFNCVGVTASIADRDWRCSTCSALLSNNSVTPVQTPATGEANIIKLSVAVSAASAVQAAPVVTDVNISQCSETIALTSNSAISNAPAAYSKVLHLSTASKLSTVSANMPILHLGGGEISRTNLTSSKVPVYTVPTLTAENIFSYTTNAGAPLYSSAFDKRVDLGNSCERHQHLSHDAQSVCSELSSKSSKSSVQHLNQKLQLLQEEQALVEKQEYILQQRKEILMQLAQEEDNEFHSDRQQQVGYPIPSQASQNSAQPPAESTRTLQPETQLAAAAQPEHSGSNGAQQQNILICQLLERLQVLESQNMQKVSNITSTQWLPGVIPPNVNERSAGIATNTTLHTETLSLSRITPEHLAARKGICKDLPKFNGRPEEWPLFLASYEQTTSLCGFSDAENLIRLRQALDGSARNSVKNLLLHASCVPQILATLRMKFGRPELIIDTLLTQIRDTPAPKETRLDSVVDFAIEVQNICATMKASGLVNHLSNPELEQELVCKLPGLLAAFWGMHKLTLPSYTLEHFSNWLFQFAQGANSVLIPSVVSKNRKRASLNAHLDATNTNLKRDGCCVCEGNCAGVINCEAFVKLTRSDKWAIVRTHKLCRRCLQKHHTDSCTSKTLCNVDGCNSVHHRLLHKNQTLENNKVVLNSGQENCNAHSQHYNTTLFRILPVTLYGDGVQIETFAFIDDGSSLTLIDEELMERLNLRGSPSPLCLRWTSNTHRYEDDSMLLNMQISGIGSAKQFALNDVHTVKSLCLPVQTLNAEKLQMKFKHLRGIPLRSYTDATPQLLIGLNNSMLSFSFKSREGAGHEPVAEKTRLGWTIKGQLQKAIASTATQHVYHICDCDASANDELLEIVKNYICLDNLGVADVSKAILSDEDILALNQLKKCTRRVGDRFETSLLWKFGDHNALPNSLAMAKRRAKCLSLKMEKDPELALALQSKIVDYLAKGYARKLDPCEINLHESWYLPVFPVINPNKPGKIRIVWDAAARVNGISLNSMLLKGPDQLASMVSVIRKFRQRRVGIGGDIAEMYHQINIREADQKYQRFLWIEPGATEPEHFVMKVMTFGATCSPSCAQYVKNSNAEEFIEQYPRATQCIIHNHYVDDMLDSVDTVQEAISLARDVRFIHSKGGFHIRNWVSNSPEVVSAMDAVPIDVLSLNGNAELPTEKVLGMWWCTSDDCLIFKISKNYKNQDVLFGKVRPTKREVLSLVMTIFDPLGLIAFYVTFAKVILQETWRTGCSWDEHIHDEQYSKWLQWLKLLPELERMKIPRCYLHSSFMRFPELEMHTFVDASEGAYAAVSYLRLSDGDNVHCSLIGCKSKVAPLKMMSIPKLELQAAILGARLAKDLCATHSVSIQRRTFWSDSTTVLAWLRSDHRKYRQFVAFRVSEILELTNLSDWRWISTSDNVADEATKWQRIPDFSSQSRWLNGPSFLKLSPNKWPSKGSLQQTSTQEELRAQYVGYHDASKQWPKGISVGPERFSTWKRLLHITASTIDILSRWRSLANKSLKEKGIYATISDSIRKAELMLYRESQACAFADEIALLTKGKHVPKSSDIYTLSPFLDGDGVLRHEGRSLLANGLHPIILPKVGHITRLIITDYHLKYRHCNHETVVNELRQKFSIPKLRAMYEKIKRSCQECRNNKAVPIPPKMSSFPKARLAVFSRTFSYTGVDYFGPLSVSVRRSTEKRYGVLFTCLTTRAVHIEISHSLSTDSCIMAVRNFIARRGTPIEIWSDNGTNFRGAEKELAEAYQLIDKDKMVRTFTSAATKWVFIPPASPHMGGAWERLVRSVKDVLYRILPTRAPTDELLRSALMEVEMIVNSRPLTYIPISHENEEALTPNHFLVGSSSGAKPLADVVDEGVLLRKNWRTAQQLANAFWKRWLREYLPVITRRCKWFNNVKKIEVDDIVYIADPELPRNSWPRGRIVEVKISSDGQVRSATVKTATGLYNRPATKIAVLDIKDDVGPLEDIPGGSVKNGNIVKVSHKCEQN